MKIKELLSKFTRYMPYIGLFVWLANHYLALEAKEARIKAAATTHNDLLERLRQMHDTTIADETIRNKIAGLSTQGFERTQDAKREIEIFKNILEELDEKIKKGEIVDQKDIDFIHRSLEIHTNEAVRNIESANSTLQEIIDSIFGPGSSDSSNFIDTSGLINSFNSILENYKSFLSTLEVEMYCPLLNTLGLITITACLASVFAIIYGDLLIKHLKLEIKYPRIAKFIELRRKFQFFYLNIDLLMILVTLVTLFYFNITHFYYLYVI